MKIRSWIIAIVATAIVATLATGQTNASATGKIIDVQKTEKASPSVQTNDATYDRAPLRTHYYVYKVTVQLNCKVYVGRYENENDDLPSALAANNSVPVRLQKGLMYLDFPGYSVKTRIVHRKASGNCDQTASAN